MGIVKIKLGREKLLKAIGYKDQIVHVFNKSELAIKQFPEIYERVKNRKNVILLWDSLWDPGMSDGFEYDNLLKIGFYNDQTPEKIEKYLESYDILLTGDSSGEELEEILSLPLQLLTKK